MFSLIKNRFVRIPETIVTLIIILSTVLAFPIAIAIADVITLKDGQTYEGIIGAQDKETILLSSPGQIPLKIYRSSIKSIEKGSDKRAIAPNHSNQVDDLRFLSCGEYYKELQTAIKNAKKSIRVMMFFINYRGRPRYPANELVNLLIDAHKRGVKVEVLLESSVEKNITEANLRAARYLNKKGIKVRFYPVYPIMHVKLVLIDGYISIVGSHNWTLASARSNVESSVLIESEWVAKEYENYFLKGFTKAKEYRGGDA